MADRRAHGTMRGWLKAALGVVFPDVCELCGTSLVSGEDTVCLNCLASMPRVNIHTVGFNDIHKRIAAPGVAIERAGAWFYYYRENPCSELIRRGKYSDKPWLCRWLGRSCATEFARDSFFDGIDLILPVGMYFLKRMKRGYNQTYMIARGINDVTGIPVGTHLHTDHSHAAQAGKSAAERVVATSAIYSARKEAWTGDGAPLSPLVRLYKSIAVPEQKVTLTTQHVLVLDDVITTGSTLLANCMALLKVAPGLRISVMSIGLSRIR